MSPIGSFDTDDPPVADNGQAGAPIMLIKRFRAILGLRRWLHVYRMTITRIVCTLGWLGMFFNHLRFRIALEPRLPLCLTLWRSAKPYMICFLAPPASSPLPTSVVRYSHSRSWLALPNYLGLREFPTISWLKFSSEIPIAATRAS